MKFFCILYLVSQINVFCSLRLSKVFQTLSQLDIFSSIHRYWEYVLLKTYEQIYLHKNRNGIDTTPPPWLSKKRDCIQEGEYRRHQIETITFNGKIYFYNCTVPVLP